MSIHLHPTLGINCRMTYCWRCGGDGPELVLLGSSNFRNQCPHCEAWVYGGLRSQPCPKCGERGIGQNRTELTKYERLPGGLCKECEDELKLHKDIVDAGGIYFKCKKCDKTGVIKGHTEIAKLVREKLKVEAPAPCGIEFDNCEHHTVKEDNG